MNLRKDEAVKQIDAAIAYYELEAGFCQHADMSDNMVVASSVVTTFFDVINRLAPSGSAFLRQAELIRAEYGIHIHKQHEKLCGILIALKNAYENNFLQDISSLLTADLFSDFIEMADHLLSEGYKDAAAVIGGSVLEEHIRKICSKNGVPILDSKNQAKKCSLMNDDLVKSGVYGKLEHKNITAWLDLRNKSAHGEYTTYNLQQVQIFLQSIRDFLIRYPA